MLTKKLLTLSLIIAITPLIGGIYGILHDQFTYTISPEYYTKFKFIQFGFVNTIKEANSIKNPRIYVSGVGFLATWWMGLFIGTLLGLVGLIYNDHKKMFRITLQSIFITLICTFLIGIAGLVYGKFYLAIEGVDWLLPVDLIDKTNFIAVGSMHNFGYFGGLIGLLLGISNSLRKKQNH